ncbi:hypothetical protein [Engelhardtia mirabilis]|uniref:Uncharacterized protein n=1 Tax=Engelhardtia mirabilis TaxID=2528011 RepID=A0A518BFB9_9BACT|nr:hypothetical protein Pla133_06680 [Planctomycetes bacterium Pla133]QDU99928.1 hypothetical protein Pla86_06670 [Planctomycetes bacterium Pla86]
MLSPRPRPRPAALIATALLASVATAQGTIGVAPLTVEGDVLAGVGPLFILWDNLEANDGGEWLVEWETTGAALEDQYLLRGGASYLREGQPLPGAPGLFTLEFGQVSINDQGDLAIALEVGGLAPPLDTGAFVDLGAGLVPLFLEGEPAVGFAPGSTWNRIVDLTINDARQVMVTGWVAPPALAAEQVIALYDLDAGGAIVGASVAATTQAPGIAGLDLEPDASAFNDLGQVLFKSLPVAAGPPATVFLNGNPIAVSGNPSPVPGRNWSGFAAGTVDLNNSGSWVLSGLLDGDSSTNRLIAVDGQKFVQSGDPVPIAGLGAQDLTGFGSAPVRIDDQGHVLWFGAWGGPAPGGALFLDDQVLIREGQTTVAGSVIASIRQGTHTLALSDDGLTILAAVELTSGLSAVVRVDRGGEVVVLITCAPNGGSLEVTSGEPLIGHSIDFKLDQCPFPFGIASIAVAPGLWPSPGPCGLFLPGTGEVAIDFLSPATLFLPMPLHLGAPSLGSFPVTAEPGLVGVPLFVQGLFIDATLTGPNYGALTNALQITFGG